MRRYALLYAGVVGVMLLVFLLVEALGVPVLTDERPLGGRTGGAAAVLGVGLLVADVVLPVPSSVVMVAHGALFGVAVGAALSMAGSLGAFAVAFALGRRGAPVVARVVADDERRRAESLLARWGTVAIVVTRPFPMLAETVAMAAGASPLGWGTGAVAAAAGSVPAAVVYAVAGAAAVDVAGGLIAFGGVALLAVGAALVVRRRSGRPTSAPAGAGRAAPGRQPELGQAVAAGQD